MSIETLSWLRLVTPGVLVFLLWSLLGFITGSWASVIPKTPEEALASWGVLAIGGLYYITPIRNLFNGGHHKKIAENLRSRLLAIAGVADDPGLYTWKKVRGIFFTLIDADTSLSTKAKLAYFNGYIWTTLADLRAVSFGMALLAVVLYLLNVDNAVWAFVIFAILSLLTFPMSNAVTKEQMSIGNEQIEIIEHEHLERLQKRLGAVRDRNAAGRDSSNQSRT